MAARTAMRGPRRAGSAPARLRSSLAPPDRAPPRPIAPPRIARSNRSGTLRSPPSRAASPSSKKARRYHSPSHASRSSEACQSGGVRAPRRGPACFPARLGDRNEGHQCRVEEPAEPDAFTVAFFADAVHAVVPVAGPHQRKPMDAELKRGVERESAMLEDGRRSGQRRSD